MHHLPEVSKPEKLTMIAAVANLRDKADQVRRAGTRQMALDNAVADLDCAIDRMLQAITQRDLD